MPRRPPVHIALSQSIIRPVLSHLVTEQASVSRDIHPDPSILCFDSYDLLAKYASNDKANRNIIRAPEAGPGTKDEVCWVMTKDDVEKTLLAQRRLIVMLNGRLKKLCPTMENGQAKKNGGWFGGLLWKKGTEENGCDGNHGEEDEEGEDPWLEVGMDEKQDEKEVKKPPAYSAIERSTSEAGHASERQEGTEFNTEAEASDTLKPAEGALEGDLQSTMTEEPDLDAQEPKRIWDQPIAESSAGKAKTWAQVAAGTLN